MYYGKDSGKIVGTLWLGKFYVLKKLEQGGMGIICLGAERFTGKKVVIKIVREKTNWRREKDILENLKGCRGIPELFDSGREKGHWILVMEYIQGDSLKHRIARGGFLKEKQLFLWMFKICRVVEVLHVKGMIHMDLKPENIMLRKGGEICLIDFGISAQDGEKIEAYGTKNYAAPEQKRRGETADLRMDIYSLGQIMKFCGEKKCSKKVRKIAERCTREKRSERYQTIRELKNEIRKQIVWMELEKAGKIAGILFIAFCGFENFKRYSDRIVYMTYEKSVTQNDGKYSNMMYQTIGTEYLFGSDEMKPDYDLAYQYFSGIHNPNAKVSAYLRILQGIRHKKMIEGKQMWEDLCLCEEDAKSLWSTLFFMKQYILWADQMPDAEKAWEKAWKFLCKTECFQENQNQRKKWQQEKLAILEHRAKQGDDRRFLEETSRPLRESMDAGEAWNLYQRKISYLQGRQREVSRYYEDFLRKYQDVSACYVEYGIYLCRKRQWKKAEDVYQKGMKRANLTGTQAETLRRKLGL